MNTKDLQEPCIEVTVPATGAPAMSRTIAQLVGLSSSFARCDCAAPIASIESERAADLLLALVDGAEVAPAFGESSERLLPGVEAVLELVLGARKEGPPG